MKIPANPPAAPRAQAVGVTPMRTAPQAASGQTRRHYAAPAATRHTRREGDR